MLLRCWHPSLPVPIERTMYVRRWWGSTVRTRCGNHTRAGGAVPARGQPGGPLTSVGSGTMMNTGCCWYVQFAVRGMRPETVVEQRDPFLTRDTLVVPDRWLPRHPVRERNW